MGADNHMTVVPSNFEDDSHKADELAELLDKRLDLEQVETGQRSREVYIRFEETRETVPESAIHIAHDFGFVPVGVIENALRLVPRDHKETFEL